jgi:tripartite-type tricarboxylate transporter receptor subunit TctC
MDTRARGSTAARRRLLGGAVGAAALLGAGATARAQTSDAARPTGADGYPSRPVRIVVPFAPGGATDLVARLVAQKMAERLGQPVTVENKPGAANVIANDFVAKSAPDGHTLLFAAAPIALNTALGMKLPYDVATDFAPVSLVASIPALVVVHAGTPYRSLADVIAAAKSTPGGLNYATAGVGSTPHLLGEALRVQSGAPLTHIGYKGAAPALQDVLAGSVPMMIDAYIPTGQQIATGKLRGIAVGAERRSPVMPDVPTTVEQGFPELIGSGFYGLLAPARTPPAIVERLHAVVVDSVNRTDVRDKLITQGYEVHASTPAEYAAFIRREIARWTPIVKAGGVKPE